MKQLCSLITAFVLAANIAQAQQDLPRLAVVEFSVNDTSDKIKRDAVTVRNLVESQMVATGKYQIVTRSEIDQLLSNQRIAVSSISSAENVKKLQLQNISYIVTGSVDAMDADYAVTVKILDVSTGQFSHSASDIMGASSRDLFAGVNTLVGNFVKGMAADGGQVAQAGSQRLRSGPSASGIGLEVSTVLGGTLYFQDEEIAALWDNDSYTIPIERPGTYKIRIVFANGQELSRNVTITSRGVVKEAFGPTKAPENLRTGNISAAVIELSWASAGQGISYRVYSGASNNPAAATLAGSTAGTSYRVTNLKPETTYYFWLSSQEGPFEGAKGQALAAKTIALQPPENLKAVNISGDTIELSWASAGQGISYRVYSGTSNNPAAAALAGTAGGTSYRASNLRPGTAVNPRPLTTYYFWVSSQAGTLESAKGQAVQAQVRVGVPGDLAEVFGTGGVSETFNAVHAFLQTCNSAGDRAGRIKARIIPGDWIDLPHLTVQGDAGGGAINTDNTGLGDNGKLLRLIVVGINSFAATNRDAPAHVVFQFQNVPGTHRMNASGTNSGGYKNSEMRAYLTGNFLRGLLAAGVPEGVLYAPVRYVANGGERASAADALMDRLWLPTERELFENGRSSSSDGTNYGPYSVTAYETAANQARLEYYESNARRIKYSANGAAREWWEASPRAGSAANFCSALNNGFSDTSSASWVDGCAPAFCVR